MQETLHDHHTFISIGGRSISNLRFVGNVDFTCSSKGKLQDFANRLADSNGIRKWNSAQKRARS